MTITSLPPPPLRSESQADFSAAADTFLAALPLFVTEANDLQVALNAIETSAGDSAAIVSGLSASLPVAEALAASFTTAGAIATYVNYSVRSTNTILAAGDRARFIDCTAAFTQTLTAAATLGAGWFCYIANNSGGSVVIDPNAAELINGSATLTLDNLGVYIVICDGTGFKSVKINNINANLSSIAGLVSAADKLPYFTGSDTAAVTTLTSYMRGLLANTNAANFLTAIGLQNVSNTSDANKPVSTATQTALNLKANLSGGSNFTGLQNFNLGNYDCFVGSLPISYVPASGRDNTGIGYNALSGVTSGIYNTALGSSALSGVTQGSWNVGIGYRAGYANPLGHVNTCIGYQAGAGLLGGGNNLLLGANATASATTVNHECTIGNGITVLRCGVTSITSTSDRRFKDNIVDSGIGLEFIKALKVREWEWNGLSEQQAGKKDLGFVAQELDEVQLAFDAEDLLGLVFKSNPEHLEATPGRLIPVLVNAIKQQSEIIAALENRIVALENKVN